MLPEDLLDSPGIQGPFSFSYGIKKTHTRLQVGENMCQSASVRGAEVSYAATFPILCSHPRYSLEYYIDQGRTGQESIR